MAAKANVKKVTKGETGSGVLFSGVIHIYGQSGGGKSTLAATAGTDPEKIVMLDGDSRKGYHLAQQTGIKYHDLTSLAEGKSEVDALQAALEVVDALPANLDVIIWDNASILWMGAHSVIRLNRPDYRKVWSTMGPIIGAQEWGAVRKNFLPGIYAKLHQKAKLVIFVSHEKEQSDSGVKTGLFIPDADKSLQIAAGMVIRLGRNTRDPDDPRPVGLLVKRPPAKVNIATREIEDILPERIAPCTWTKMAEYLENPIGNRARTTEEVLDDHERHMVQGTLNPDDQKRFEWRQEMALLGSEDNLEVDVLESASQKGDMKAGFMYRAVVKELAERYPNLDIDRVQEIVEESKNGKSNE